MSPYTNSARRRFLQSAFGGAAGLMLLEALPFASAGTVAAPLASTPLADRFQLLTGAGGNVLALETGDGILLVDGGEARHAAGLLRQVTGSEDSSRVRALINTHWHPEQTGANEALGRQGTRIIAHENTKLWLGTDIDVKWQGKVYPPLPREALPTATTYTGDKLDFGGEAVEYGYLGQAHTDGDLYVFFPAHNVLAVGDVLGAGSYPILDWCTGGWIGGLIAANKRLLDMTDASTRIVAGQGGVQSRTELEAQHDMLVAVRGQLVTMLKKGMSADEMIAAAPTKEFDPKWGDPKLLIANAYPGMVGHVRELGGIL